MCFCEKSHVRVCLPRPAQYWAFLFGRHQRRRMALADLAHGCRNTAANQPDTIPIDEGCHITQEVILGRMTVLSRVRQTNWPAGTSGGGLSVALRCCKNPAIHWPHTALQVALQTKPPCPFSTFVKKGQGGFCARIQSFAVRDSQCHQQSFEPYVVATETTCQLTSRHFSVFDHSGLESTSHQRTRNGFLHLRYSASHTTARECSVWTSRITSEGTGLSFH